jgi:hypothetical protein
MNHTDCKWKSVESKSMKKLTISIFVSIIACAFGLVGIEASSAGSSTTNLKFSSTHFSNLGPENSVKLSCAIGFPKSDGCFLLVLDKQNLGMYLQINLDKTTTKISTPVSAQPLLTGAAPPTVDQAKTWIYPKVPLLKCWRNTDCVVVDAAQNMVMFQNNDWNLVTIKNEGLGTVNAGNCAFTPASGISGNGADPTNPELYCLLVDPNGFSLAYSTTNKTGAHFDLLGLVAPGGVGITRNRTVGCDFDNWAMPWCIAGDDAGNLSVVNTGKKVAADGSYNKGFISVSKPFGAGASISQILCNGYWSCISRTNDGSVFISTGINHWQKLTQGGALSVAYGSSSDSVIIATKNGIATYDTGSKKYKNYSVSLSGWASSVKTSFDCVSKHCVSYGNGNLINVLVP